jgi:hypothetical protein
LQGWSQLLDFGGGQIENKKFEGAKTKKRKKEKKEKK